MTSEVLSGMQPPQRLGGLSIVLVAIIFSVPVKSAAIFSGPDDQVVAPGDLVYFHCHARGTSVKWHINGTIASPKREYEQMGFRFIDRQLPNGEHNNTIVVTASKPINNTQIECTVREFVGVIAEAGTLIIAGPPLSPRFNLSVVYSVSNRFHHTLHWDEPFTWLEFPVTGYTINITNHSSEVVTTDIIIQTINSSGTHFSHSFSSNGNSCYEMDIILSATNKIGESELTIEHTGHPIAIRNVADVELVTTTLSNGTIHFWIRFMAPSICPSYQVGTYNVSVYDNHQPIYFVGPNNYTQESIEEPIVIMKEIEAGRQHYQYKITISSEGITHTKMGTIDTVPLRMLVCNISKICGIDQYVTTTEVKECNERNVPNNQTKFSTITVPEAEESIPSITYKDHNSMEISTNRCITTNDAIIAGVIPSVVFMILIALIAVVIICFFCKRKRQGSQTLNGGPAAIGHRNCDSDSRMIPLRMEASNPIYEGVMYEITPGETLKSLDCDTPSTSLAGSAATIRYAFNMGPTLPPPRKPSVSCKPNGNCKGNEALSEHNREEDVAIS